MFGITELHYSGEQKVDPPTPQPDARRAPHRGAIEL
jgi:hypothetical protein